MKSEDPGWTVESTAVSPWKDGPQWNGSEMDLMGLRSLIIVHAAVFFEIAQPNNIHGSLSLCPLYPLPFVGPWRVAAWDRRQDTDPPQGRLGRHPCRRCRRWWETLDPGSSLTDPPKSAGPQRPWEIVTPHKAWRILVAFWKDQKNEGWIEAGMVMYCRSLFGHASPANPAWAC